MSQEQERLVWQAIGMVNDGDVEGIVAMTAPAPSTSWSAGSRIWSARPS